MKQNNTSPSVSCDEVLNYICSQFGEEDDSERCRLVKEHLHQCPDCNHYCDSIEKMIGLYRAASPGFSSEAKDILLETLGIKRT